MSFDLAVVLDFAPMLLAGLRVTATVFLGSLALMPLLGSLLAWASASRRLPVRLPAVAFIEWMRNTPFLIQAFVVFFGLPFLGVPLDPVLTGITTLALYFSAYFAEAARAALNAIPRGQWEAAEALGLSRPQRLRHVIVPQMWSFLLPQLANLAVLMIKESAVLSVITVPELTFATQRAISYTFRPVEFFTVLALAYWLLSALVVWLLGALERRSTRYLRSER